LRCALVIVRDESGRLFLDTALQQASPLHRPPLIFHQAGYHVRRNRLPHYLGWLPVSRQSWLKWRHFSPATTEAGMKRWVGLGVIADNLINIGRALAN